MPSIPEVYGENHIILDVQRVDPFDEDFGEVHNLSQDEVESLREIQKRSGNSLVFAFVQTVCQDQKIAFLQENEMQLVEGSIGLWFSYTIMDGVAHFDIHPKPTLD